MKKQQWLLIAVTGVFLCIILGIFIGRNLVGNYISIGNTSNSAATEATLQEEVSDGKININTASLDQLQLLPGIGEVMAQRIINYRTDNGDFSSVEELMNVSGIGEKKFEQLKPYIKVGG